MPDKDLPPIGTVMLSCAGRDRGRYFVIVEHCDEDGYVMIADGALRKMERPKKKKLKHLKARDVVIPVIRQRIEAKERLYDYEIRSHLESLGYNR